MTRIITDYICFPAEYQHYNWCACREGKENAPYSFGYGVTKEEAVADMLRLERYVQWVMGDAFTSVVRKWNGGGGSRRGCALD